MDDGQDKANGIADVLSRYFQKTNIIEKKTYKLKINYVILATVFLNLSHNFKSWDRFILLNNYL